MPCWLSVLYGFNYVYIITQEGTVHIVFFFWFLIYQGNKIAKSEVNYKDRKKSKLI
jgi:hypothetical protein